MLVAFCESSRSAVEARRAGAGNHCCPSCGEPVTLRAGKVRVPHFAHLPSSSCPLSTGESAAHLEAKQAIFDGLLQDPRASSVSLERYLQIAVPDIYFEVEGRGVAVEVQRSDITIDTVMVRTGRYAKMNVAVLWVILGQPNRLKAWQKWLQSAYFGRIYSWTAGQIVQPLHYYGDQVVKGMPVPIAGFAPSARRETWVGNLQRSQAKAVINPFVAWKDKQPRWWKTQSDVIAEAGAGALADLTPASGVPR